MICPRFVEVCTITWRVYTRLYGVSTRVYEGRTGMLAALRRPTLVAAIGHRAERIYAALIRAHAARSSRFISVSR